MHWPFWNFFVPGKGILALFFVELWRRLGRGISPVSVVCASWVLDSMVQVLAVGSKSLWIIFKKFSYNYVLSPIIITINQ